MENSVILDIDRSKLLDVSDCKSVEFEKINDQLAQLQVLMQPFWFRPIFKSEFMRHYLGCWDFNPTRNWEYPYAILNADLNPDMRVLDVGCAGSAIPLYFAGLGLSVFAIDPDLNLGEPINDWSIKYRLAIPMGIKFTSNFRPNKKLTKLVNYKRETIQNMIFEDNLFDRVFCLSVIEHIPQSEWSICMKQLIRILRPGGRLIITFDMASRDAYRYKDLISGIKVPGDIDHSIPANIRHPDWKWETVGLVIEKK